MRFKVPQNIDMPDRILGPLTMLQFIYAVIGGGLAYVCFMSLPSPVGIFLAVIVAILTLAIIFLKVNERPFLVFLLSLIKFISSPKQRVWEKGQNSDIKVEIYKSNKTDTGPHVQQKNISHEDIERAAKRMDSGVRQ